MAAEQKTRFRISVTEEDIAKAQKNNSYKCVVAQAIARTIPDATRIEVDTQAIRFTRAETGERLLYLTPPAAIGYVVAFDAGEPPEPFRFWINNPMRIGRKIRTEAGRAVDNAREKARREGRRRPTVVQTKVTSEELAPAEQAEVMKEAYVAAKEELTEPEQKSDGGGRQKNPRVYRTGRRVYGSRILRVNRYLNEQEKAEA